MPLRIEDDGAFVLNDVVLEDAPALIIAGDNIRFTNTEAGRIRSTSSAEPAIRIDGAGAVIVNDFGAIIRGVDLNSPAIIGSAYNDTIVNAGLIVGTVTLGEGNDSFTQNAQGTSALIDFGDGDDRYGIGPGNGYSAQPASGGAGLDTVVLTGAIGQIDGSNVTGFERLEIGTGVTNLQNFSGFSEVVVAAGAFTNLLGLYNPAADLTLNGGFTTLNNGTIFQSVVGSDAVERLEITSTADVLESVALGGGDDILFLSVWPPNGGAALFDGPVDGGDGNDTIGINVNDGRTVSLAQLTNFETVRLNNFTNLEGNVRVTGASGLTLIATGSSARFVLAAADLPDATIQMGYPSTLILEPGTTVWRIGWFEGSGLIDPGSVTQADDRFSSTFTNSGSVLGDIRFFAGDDVYDGRLGTVGGLVSGYAGNDRLYGGAGHDRLNGGLGADWLEGGAGGDVLFGEDGSDRFYGGMGSDWIDGGAGDDVVYGGLDNDTLLGGDGSDWMTGEDGDDWLEGGAANDFLHGEAGDDRFYGGAGNDNIAAGAGADVAYGGAGNDILVGGDGSDWLTGEAGDDWLEGGEANDFLHGEDGDDRFYGGAGNDNIAAGAGNDVGYGGSGNDTLVGGDGSDWLTGEAEDDWLEGGSGNDFLLGESGNDRIYGGADNDNVAAGAGDDVVYGGSGNDTLSGGGDADWMTGEAGDDRLDGGDGNDALLGEDGNDTLNGGLGADALAGGAGADRFWFETQLGAGNVDLVTDFLSGTDRILLDRAAFAGLGLGALAANAFVVGTAAQDADDRILYDPSTGALFFDADGNGAGAAIRFATLDGAPTLLASDFIIV